MKKVALMLVMLLTLSICGCASETKKSDLEVDIEYYANLGQIPESEYSLGSEIAIFEQLAAESAEAEHTHDEDEVYYEIAENDGYTEIYAGSLNYYYETDKKDDGVSCIVSYDGGYGFKQGSMSIEIRDELAAAGFEAEEQDAEKSDVFFLPSSGSFTCLEYTFKENTVRFIFEENALCACTLTGADWSL